jgi:hypothetical protein
MPSGGVYAIKTREHLLAPKSAAIGKPLAPQRAH